MSFSVKVLEIVSFLLDFFGAATLHALIKSLRVFCVIFPIQDNFLSHRFSDRQPAGYLQNLAISRHLHGVSVSVLIFIGATT